MSNLVPYPPGDFILFLTASQSNFPCMEVTLQLGRVPFHAVEVPPSNLFFISIVFLLLFLIFFFFCFFSFSNF
jgi:hypothetical protein